MEGTLGSTGVEVEVCLTVFTEVVASLVNTSTGSYYFVCAFSWGTFTESVAHLRRQ